MSTHNHTHNTSSKNLVWSISINICIVIFEIIFGIISRSMALISDSFHNMTDIGSMVLSLFGEKVSNWSSNDRKTYGYKRAEILVAFTNATILLAVTLFIIFESIQRLLNPTEVASAQMIMVATIALLGNGIATYLLQKKDADKNLNLKSAWLHSLQDAIFSFAVIIGAIIMHYTAWVWIDSVLSILISFFLIKSIYKILIQSINILLDSVPSHIVLNEVKDSILGISEIQSVHDLHIWQTGSANTYLTVHLKINDQFQDFRSVILSKIQKILHAQYDIEHSTIQILTEGESENVDLSCGHCN